MRGTALSGAARGFTLIEMLVVMLIIALLAGIAIPMYNDYTKKTKATEAWEELTHIAALEEQIYTDLRAYDTSTNGTMLASYGATMVGKYFAVTMDNPTGWTATAYLCFGGAKDGSGNTICTSGTHDYKFTLNSLGAKKTTPKGGSEYPGWSL